MSFLLRFLTWWNSQTLNTQFWTWRHGVRVGEDGAGNIFYQTKDGKRRWVIYGAEAEASQITPEWHGWLHHTWAEPPTELAVPRKAWEQPHKSNQTGTPGAYVPAGSLYRAQPEARSDYDAWRPE
ncbi:NADH:ubiquinone oxidoreductase subunit NDUFA12 [Paracoccus liaowanqingii]|uniref:NADH:ubiquinone oxidoreductase subunit NDUFA12 n=1 Tax=Paracoccus liaowanqingii TaxID=2560053 RepID=A0A4Z1BKA8_9RHOB|nr:NADH:ubiquinone oxidoreductase subunit NDUFA12 [Paracoccus liaowanqingii]TGN59385.1 NADH:ubiquinone oxidoreductase subunit NDUFA12 [Paracoccus liaowanqingii]